MLHITKAARAYVRASDRLAGIFETLQTHDPNNGIDADNLLDLVNGRLALKVPDSIAKKPFYVDFQDYIKRLHRIQHHQWQGEYLVQAFGKAPLRIVDATAGFGRDSFLLACAGHHVTGFEQNPLIALLVLDALQQRYTDCRVNDACRRMEVLPHLFDHGHLHQHLEMPPEAIYLDPMFEYPSRSSSKSAKNEKYTQMLQYINGLNHDQCKPASLKLAALLQTARDTNAATIVIKKALANTETEPLNDKDFTAQYQRKTERKGKGFTILSYARR